MPKLGQHGRFQGQHGNQGGGQVDGLGGGKGGAVVPAEFDHIDHSGNHAVKGVGPHGVDHGARIMIGMIFGDHKDHHAGEGQVQREQHCAAEPVFPVFRRLILPKSVPVGVAEQQEAHDGQADIVDGDAAEPEGVVKYAGKEFGDGVNAIDGQRGIEGNMGAERHIVQITADMLVFAFHNSNPFSDLLVCRQTDYRQRIRGQNIRQVGKNVVSKIKGKNAGQQNRADHGQTDHGFPAGKQDPVQYFFESFHQYPSAILPQSFLPVQIYGKILLFWLGFRIV